MIAMGFFEGEKLELLRGELVKMSPIGTRHSWSVAMLQRLLMRVLAERADVLSQAPFIAADESEPEPDVLVVPPIDPRNHASHAYLIVEIAESSLDYDLTRKAALYAESNVEEYWVVDLQDDVVHVHRDRAGGRWRTISTHPVGDVLHPVAFPDVAIEIAAFVQR